jgi:hypothetical protein
MCTGTMQGKRSGYAVNNPVRSLVGFPEVVAERQQDKTPLPSHNNRNQTAIANSKV